MKIRMGFVSNSSSASFMIPKSALTEEQIEQIKNHIEVSEANLHKFRNAGEPLYREPWRIVETEHSIKGHTPMDNFDMYFFLETIIEFDMSEVSYDGENHWRLDTDSSAILALVAL